LLSQSTEGISQRRRPIHSTAVLFKARYRGGASPVATRATARAACWSTQAERPPIKCGATPQLRTDSSWIGPLGRCSHRFPTTTGRELRAVADRLSVGSTWWPTDRAWLHAVASSPFFYSHARAEQRRGWRRSRHPGACATLTYKERCERSFAAAPKQIRGGAGVAATRTERGW
jgi:hypothetical protein